MPRKKTEDKPKVHDDLSGFEFKVNSFGEVSGTFTIEQINSFLNKNVEDKKLKSTSNSKN